MTKPEYISKRISEMPYGTVFIVADFSDVSTYENTRKILIRLENKGEIRRILPGIYDKPAFSEILNEYAAPDPNSVAEAIARKNNWTIAASGNTALNLLGLSTQVPAKWEYISNGPSGEYQIDHIKIRFSHRANKDLANMSRKTALVIQSLKAIGKDNLTPELTAKIAKRLSSAEAEKILNEAKPATRWVFEEVKGICNMVHSDKQESGLPSDYTQEREAYFRGKNIDELGDEAVEYARSHPYQGKGVRV